MLGGMRSAIAWWPQRPQRAPPAAADAQLRLIFPLIVLVDLFVFLFFYFFSDVLAAKWPQGGRVALAPWWMSSVARTLVRHGHAGFGGRAFVGKGLASAGAHRGASGGAVLKCVVFTKHAYLDQE